MSRLTTTILCLLVANIMLGLALLGVVYLQGSSSGTLRLAGTLDDGGYRLLIKGRYSRAEIARVQRQVKERLDMLDEQFAYARPDSAVSHLAMTPPFKLALLSPALQDAIAHLYQAQKLSGGHFSPFESTPFTAWWLYQHQCVSLVQRFTFPAQTMQKGLHFGDYFIPLMPVSLNIKALTEGLALDALARVMQDAHITAYRLEVNGSLRGQGDHWRVALFGDSVESLEGRVAMHGTSRDGQPLWVFAPTGIEAATQLDALTALDAEAARQVAAEQGISLRLKPKVSP